MPPKTWNTSTNTTLTRSTDCSFCGQLLTGKRLKYCDDECSKQAARWRWVLKTYGLTPEDYERILLQQGYRCGCCGKPFKEGKTPHIDHEHGGHVRGIVCPYCNTRLIGRLKSHELAQRLADYLLNPPAVEALGAKVVAPGRPPKKRKPRKKRGVA